MSCSAETYFDILLCVTQCSSATLVRANVIAKHQISASTGDVSGRARANATREFKSSVCTLIPPLMIADLYAKILVVPLLQCGVRLT